MRDRSLLFIIWLLGLALPSARAQPFVEVSVGDYPLVISAPHGGYLTPDGLKDRTCSACVTVRDSRTQEWARHLSDELFDLTGRRPSVVINLLARTKLDANREVIEAADGDPTAASAWATYHAAIDSAKARITNRFGAGLVLDLHGHGHPVLRFELGYLLSATSLRQTEAEVDGRVSRSSFRALAARQATSLSALIRGPDSFGAFLGQRGVLAVPSPLDPAPGQGEAFFSGGYITARHGSRDAGQVDAIQLEAYRVGARDSDANVAILAKKAAGAVVAFMERWYSEAVGTAVSDEPIGPNAACIEAWAVGSTLSVRLRCPALTGSLVTMFDVTGRTVSKNRLGPNTIISTNGLASGVYFLRAPAMKRAFPVVVR